MASADRRASEEEDVTNRESVMMPEHAQKQGSTQTPSVASNLSDDQRITRTPPDGAESLSSTSNLSDCANNALTTMHMLNNAWNEHVNAVVAAQMGHHMTEMQHAMKRVLDAAQRSEDRSRTHTEDEIYSVVTKQLIEQYRTITTSVRDEATSQMEQYIDTLREDLKKYRDLQVGAIRDGLTAKFNLLSVTTSANIQKLAVNDQWVRDLATALIDDRKPNKVNLPIHSERRAVQELQEREDTIDFKGRSSTCNLKRSIKTTDDMLRYEPERLDGNVNFLETEKDSLAAQLADNAKLTDGNNALIFAKLEQSKLDHDQLRSHHQELHTKHESLKREVARSRRHQDEDDVVRDRDIEKLWARVFSRR